MGHIALFVLVSQTLLHDIYTYTQKRVMRIICNKTD